MPLGLALQCKKSCHTKMSEAGQHLCILYHKHLDLREWHSVLLSTPTPSCTSSTLRCGCRDRQSYGTLITSIHTGPGTVSRSSY